MTYLPLGIVRENIGTPAPLGCAAFREWKLLYYQSPHAAISAQEHAQIHFREVQRVFEGSRILPFGFGNFVSSKAEMVSLLADNQKRIAEEWERIADTAEVRLTFAEGAISIPLPEKLASQKPGISFWQKKYRQHAQVRYFQSVLDKKESILDSQTKVTGGKVTLDFLIPKSRIVPFYQSLSETLEELYIFQHEVSKPTAPFTFVRLILEK